MLKTIWLSGFYNSIETDVAKICDKTRRNYAIFKLWELWGQLLQNRKWILNHRALFNTKQWKIFKSTSLLKRRKYVIVQCVSNLSFLYISTLMEILDITAKSKSNMRNGLGCFTSLLKAKRSYFWRLLKNSSHIQTQCLVKRAFKLRNGCVENECFINASVYAPNFKSGFDGTMKISLNSLFKYLLLYTFLSSVFWSSIVVGLFSYI